MSWLFSSGSNVAFDELVDKATSELLPPGDDETLLTSLQMSDMIRSKAVDSTIALKSLRRRIAHKNPNVQIQALNVLDVLVKNSGEAFLLVVGNGKDNWMGQLEELCRSTNNDVRMSATKNLQNWALAFQSSDTSSSLSSSDLVSLYNRLRYSIDFPATSSAMNASMITSLSAPEWVDSELCQRCRTPFTVTNRKHHCRNCGGVFCGECSGKKMKLEHLGIDQEVRVCDGCYKKLSMPGGRSASVSKPSTASSSSTAHKATSSASSGSRKTQEEIDFERAIAASLAEAGPSQPQPQAASSYGASGTLPGVGYGYELRPSQPPSSSHASSVNGYAPSISASASDTASLMPTKQLEAEDPDLAAAIRASLADAPPPPVASTSSAPYQASAPYAYTPQQASLPSVPSYELTTSEFDALDSFSNAMTRNEQNVKADDANELFYSADKHRGKMMRAHQDSEVKTQMLDELNRKLQRAVRLYDSLLERGIGRYNQPMHSGYQAQPYQQQPQQSYYQPQQQQQYGQQAPPQHYQPYQTASPAPHPMQVPNQQQAYPNMSGLASAPVQQQPSMSSYDGQQQPLQRQTSRKYDGQQQQQQQQQQHRQPQQAYDAQQYQHDPYSVSQQRLSQEQQPHQPYSHAPVDQQYAPPEQHAVQDDNQYYHSEPQGYQQPEPQPLAYPASAYPYNEPQPNVPYPPTSPAQQQQQPEYAQSHEGYEAAQQQPADLAYEASAPGQPQGYDQQQQQHRSQHQNPEQLYGTQGTKLRLQGYYKPSSFPSVPDNPVGSLDLPDAPNGEIVDRHEQHYSNGRQEERKQEDALIEF